MASIIKVDQIQSDTGTVNLSSNIAFTGSAVITSPTITGNVNFDGGTLFVDSVGNKVGIGTTTPTQYALEVFGSTTNTSAIRVKTNQAGVQASVKVDSGTNYASRVDFLQNGSNKWSLIQDYNQNGTNDLTFEQAGSIRGLWDSGGRLLVGKTSASNTQSQMEVGGTGNLAGNYFIHRYGNGIGETENICWGESAYVFHDNVKTSTLSVAANFAGSRATPIMSVRNNGVGAAINSESGAITQPSDYRIKRNIIPLTQNIERIKKLNPIEYSVISEYQEPGKEKHEGFIAHEVQEVVPFAVCGEKDALNEDGSLNIQLLDKGRLIPLIVGALKDSLNKIEELENRIKELENK